MIAKMIADQYIMEGIRLRKTYIENLKQILVQEPVIYQKKTAFDNLRNEMEGIVKSDLNEIMKTIELNNKLIALELSDLKRKNRFSTATLMSRYREFSVFLENHPTENDESISLPLLGTGNQGLSLEDSIAE